MNITSFTTKHYENIPSRPTRKNKPNSNPIKPNQSQLKPIKANKMPKQTQYKPNQTQFQSTEDGHIIGPLYFPISTQIPRFPDKVPANNRRKYSLASRKTTQKEVKQKQYPTY